MNNPSPPTLDPAQWVDQYGDYLFGYAMLRVRDRTVAEDLVQDALLTAFKARDRFEGRSTERTWLTGILKNKLREHWRKNKREITETDLAAPGEDPADLFDAVGHINADHAPADWGSDPVAAASRTEFQTVLAQCIEGLPDRAAEVFLAREVDGASTDEILKSTGITKSNLWVLIHRARKLLRQCLETNWFAKNNPSPDP
ncbi:MAG: sigma-70 family RNA polymerase sigma factor [Verrucomicrobiota bacterium]